MPQRPLFALCIPFVVLLLSPRRCDGTGSEVKVAYHVLWNASAGGSLAALLEPLAHPGHTYLVDVLSPSDEASAQSAALYRIGVGVLGRAHVDVDALRVRPVDAYVPRGPSEAIALLDGMGELLWWGRAFDYYVPVWGGGGADATPWGSGVEAASRLAPLEGKRKRTASILRISPAESQAVNTLHHDAALVFSRSAAARSALITQGRRTPDQQYRRTPFHRADRRMALAAALVRHAVDDADATRLLCALSHAADVVEHLFGTLAVTSRLPLNATAI